MKPSEFWELTWSEFEMMSKHYYNEQEQVWDYLRHHASVTVSPHLKKYLKPSEIWRLKRDGIVNELITNEEFEEMKARWN